MNMKRLKESMATKSDDDESCLNERLGVRLENQSGRSNSTYTNSPSGASATDVFPCQHESQTI